MKKRGVNWDFVLVFLLCALAVFGLVYFIYNLGGPIAGFVFQGKDDGSGNTENSNNPNAPGEGSQAGNGGDGSGGVSGSAGGSGGGAGGNIGDGGQTDFTQCIDGLDNDGDGKIDFADPGCVSEDDDDETDEFPPEENWGKINNDCDALYQGGNANRGNLSLNVLDNGQSFELVRYNLDGTQTVLRKQTLGEKFFSKNNNNPLVITYQIQDKTDCGGVDIVYTLNNPTNNDVSMPIFLQVQGITQTVDKNKDGWYIYPFTYGNLILMKKNETTGDFNSAYLGNRFYPHSYSPVIVTKDDNFSVGSSLMYPYLDYKHKAFMTIIKNESGTWIHRYSNFGLFNGSYSALAPGETRTYTISLRFTRPDSDYFLFTLKPYRDYFNSLYGAGRTAPEKDLRPIMNVALAAQEFNYTNPGNLTVLRRYDPRYLDPSKKYNFLKNGFTPLFDELVANAKKNNFQRIFFWLVSGMYPGDDPGNEVWNYPPQFMDFIPGPLADPEPFKNFSKAEIDLLLWWGRSTQIPYNGTNGEGHILNETEWAPSSYKNAKYDDSTHIAFLKNQLRKAVCDRGASGLGLDAFSGSYMPPDDRYKWVEDMKAYAKAQCGTDITLYGEGAQPDLIHSRIGNFYAPCKHIFLAGPDLLSYYINPGSEIQVLYGGNKKDGSIPICDYEGEYGPEYDPHTFDEVKKHTQWGYTRLTKVSTDVKDLNNVKENECFDRKDNGDGDSAVDFPFDPECLSFTDDSEES